MENSKDISPKRKRILNILADTNKIKDEVKKCFAVNAEEVVHYTDLSALISIVKNNSLWLSDYRFLNDTNEFRDGYKILLKVLKKFSKQDFGKYNMVIKEAIESIEQENFSEKIFYVCSFSTKKDDLNQWRSYASSENGVAIVFDKNIMQNKLANFFIDTHSVIYENKEKKLEKIITDFFANLSKLDYEFEEVFIYVLQDLIEVLLTFCICCKDNTFESESEVRFIVSQDRTYKSPNRIVDVNIKHRMSRNKIIPYIESQDFYQFKEGGKIDMNSSDKLNIKEIIISPNCNNESLIKLGIESLLISNEYKDVKITKSKIPFRG